MWFISRERKNVGNLMNLLNRLYVFSNIGRTQQHGKIFRNPFTVSWITVTIVCRICSHVENRFMCGWFMCWFLSLNRNHCVKHLEKKWSNYRMQKRLKRVNDRKKRAYFNLLLCTCVYEYASFFCRASKCVLAKCVSFRFSCYQNMCLVLSFSSVYVLRDPKSYPRCTRMLFFLS